MNTHMPKTFPCEFVACVASEYPGFDAIYFGTGEGGAMLPSILIDRDFDKHGKAVIRIGIYKDADAQSWGKAEAFVEIPDFRPGAIASVFSVLRALTGTENPEPEEPEEPEACDYCEQDSIDTCDFCARAVCGGCFDGAGRCPACYA